MAENEAQGITRRDLLKRGAALGGAVVWATPVVQTLGMGRAFAQVPSPVDGGISFIALNVTCGGTAYTVKWEADENDWVEPGSVPGCEGIFAPTGTKAIGDTDLGLSVGAGTDPGCFSVNLAGCTFNGGVVKGGKDCQTITNLNNICI